MAVPSDFTTQDISGKFVINKTLSGNDGMTEILSLQGVPWILRKGISVATVTFNIKHYKTNTDTEQIDVVHTITGGIQGTTEERTLDDEQRHKKDYILGPTVGSTKRVTRVDEIPTFSRDGWTADTLEKGLIIDITDSVPTNARKSWKLIQLWGVQEISHQRRYTRHVHFTGPRGDVVETKMYYDYIGSIL
ncbi:hypothetical protein DL96DRAFT_1765790 [Flagelloscypha sp. PMI_526]|nr:hypothetical protein DL96DRAFT_1765790 [Flagelloscypha sp. PMI_526]